MAITMGVKLLLLAHKISTRWHLPYCLVDGFQSFIRGLHKYINFTEQTKLWKCAFSFYVYVCMNYNEIADAGFIVFA